MIIAPAMFRSFFWLMWKHGGWTNSQKLYETTILYFSFLLEHKSEDVQDFFFQYILSKHSRVLKYNWAFIYIFKLQDSAHSETAAWLAFSILW